MLGKKILIIKILVFLAFIFLVWSVIFYAYQGSLKLSFYADDWAVIWGVKQQTSIFFNPLDVQWYYHQFEYTSRIGNLQIWTTGVVYKLFQLDPYWYHYVSLILKTGAVAGLVLTAWYLTRNFFLGILAGLFFAVTFTGLESVFWYNVSAVYIFIIFVLLSLAVYIKSINSKNNLFIIALLTIALGIYIYPPRAHIFLGFPIVGFIFAESIKNKRLWIRLTATVVVTLVSFKYLVGSQGVEVANGLIARAMGGITDGLERNRIMLTYPLNIISISALSEGILKDLADFPEKLKPTIEKFYLWSVVIFPIAWYFLTKVLTEVSNKKNRFKSIFLSGLSWLGLNMLLRIFFFDMLFIKSWDWPMHFMFLLSGLIVVLAINMYILQKNQDKFGMLVRLFLSSITLVFFGYLVNWFIDPLQFPAFYDGARYFTVSTVFGSLALAIFIFWLIISVNKILKINTPRKNIFNIGLISLVLVFCYIFITKNIESTKYQLDSLDNIRSHKSFVMALDKISTTADLKNVDPPPFLIIDAADGIENISFFAQTFALWNDINNPDQFPFVYHYHHDVEKNYQEYCLKFNGKQPKAYQFLVKKDQTLDNSSELPELSCLEKNIKLTE